MLKTRGRDNLRVVESQRRPDGDFPTVAVPNPENKACFAEAIDLVLRDGADCDLIIGTDPDADRVGVVVKDANGLFVPLSGNERARCWSIISFKPAAARGRCPKTRARSNRSCPASCLRRSAKRTA